MKINTLAVLLLFFAFAACGEERPSEEELMEDTPRVAFFNNVQSLCGETFSGESTYPDDPDHDLVDTGLEVYVRSCEEDRIKVDLLRDGGDTWHATWVLEMRELGLHLYHDHIGDKEYEEGEEPLTGYGGYADDRGTEFLQYFPADEHTAEILPEAETNVWSLEYYPTEEKLVYYLERHQEPRFRAEVFLN